MEQGISSILVWRDPSKQKRQDRGKHRKGHKAQAKESGLSILLIGKPLKEMLSTEILWSETSFLSKNCKIR